MPSLHKRSSERCQLHGASVVTIFIPVCKAQHSIQQLACKQLLSAGIIGRQLTLGRAASTMSRFSYSLPRNPSGAAGLLSASSGESNLVGLPSERRRSMTMGHMPRPGLTRATSRFQDVMAPRDTRYVTSHAAWLVIYSHTSALHMLYMCALLCLPPNN